MCGSSRIFGCRSALHCSRAWRMSGRSHSLARSVFFKAIAVTDEPPRDRGGSGLRATGRFELPRQFRHRDVVLLRHTTQEKHPMRIELGVPAAAKRLGLEAAAQAIGRHQIDDERNRDPEVSRGGSPRTTGFDLPDNAFTQIVRIGLRHRKSPPHGSESQFQSNRNPNRFKLTVRRSSNCNDWQKMAKRSLRRFPNLVSGPAWLRPMPWRR